MSEIISMSNNDDEKLARKIVESHVEIDPKNISTNKRFYLLGAIVLMIVTVGIIIISYQIFLNFLSNKKDSNGDPLKDLSSILEDDDHKRFDEHIAPSLIDKKSETNISRLKNVEKHFDHEKKGYIEVSLKKNNLDLKAFNKNTGKETFLGVKTMEELQEISTKYIEDGYMVFIDIKDTDKDLNASFMKFCVRQKTPFYEKISK